MFGFARGALVSLLVSLSLAPAAAAAVGEPLGSFVPERGGNGRGIAVSGTTGYYTTNVSEDSVFRVNLRTHASLELLDTNLDVVAPGIYAFGALDIDPQGKLWGADYMPSSGWINRIDPSTGAVERILDAEEVNAELTGIDGLAVDADETLWISGEGQGVGETSVFHVTQAGAIISSFEVPFGNSGLEVDAEGLWLANIDQQKIHRYDRAGNPTGVEFSVAPVNPEDLALDPCSFPGRLALWTYGADLGAGPLAAYDVGAADSGGCPAETEMPQSGGGQGGGEVSAIGGSGSSPVAGRNTWLSVYDPRDPNGTLFVYVWRFGDGRKARGKGRIAHRYRCAGLYRVRVTVIDTTGARRTYSGRVSVAFPRSATKRYRGIAFGPSVSIAGRKAIASMRWAGRSRNVEPQSVTWKIDRTRFFPALPKARAKAPIVRRRNHSLRAKVQFSDGGRRTISTCFYG